MKEINIQEIFQDKNKSPKNATNKSKPRFKDKSKTSNKEDLLHWYSLEDAKQLIKNGFVFTRYLAQDYIEYPLETTFLKETSLAR